MTRRNRNLCVQLLSLAMFVAQWGMLVHASTHLNSDPHAALTQAQACGECLSFASLHNAAGGTASVVRVVKPPVLPVVQLDAVAAPAPREFDAFRSRAPPRLL